MTRGVGVDGCRAGWIVASIAQDHDAQLRVAANIAEALAGTSKAPLLIDMPIGLASQKPRQAEALARAALGRPRASSVFAVPCRAAVYATDYTQACARNRAAWGKAISRQAWNICPRIAELDAQLRAIPSCQQHIREAHPELCFWALNGKQAMRHSKKTLAGRRERLALLARHWPQARTVYRRYVRRWPRGAVAQDDILDALVLAVSAAFFPLQPLPAGSPPRDRHGLAMQIHHPQTH